MNKQIVKKAFADTVAVLTGYVVLGIGFGILLKSKGLGISWAFAMSAFIYAGSMQFLTIDLISSSASLITVAVTTLMVNARHLFYGISMVDRYKNTGKAKPYLIYALTDETYSLVCAPNDMEEGDRKKYYVWVSLLNNIYWVGGCVLGALIGTYIHINVEGIDFALTALFLTVFVEQWLSTKDHRAAIIGVVTSIVCLLIFGKDNFLIPSMLVITLLLTMMRTDKEADT